MQRGFTGAVGLGIDFGTSNSVAATFDGTALNIMEFGLGKNSLPSATYLDRSYLALTGQEALDVYIEKNTGRRVELSAVPLGEARTSTGSYDEQGLPQVANSQLLFSAPMFDVNLPGRLFYGSKQLLSSLDAQVLPVFDRQYRLEAIITPIILRLRKSLQAALAKQGLEKQSLEKALSHVVAGRPVHFEKSSSHGNSSESNERAAFRLQTAYGNAGFSDQQFCYEPVAAAVSYLHGNDNAGIKTLLTVDFGGGTLDFSVFRKNAQNFTVIGTHGIALGGNHIDQLLFRKLLFPLLGEGAKGKFLAAESATTMRFPFEEYADLLLNWPVSYMLNQNRYLTPAKDMLQQGGEAATCFQHLLDLIQFNYSYLVFDHIKKFKEKFASHASATLDIPELDITLNLDRDGFSAAIAPAITRFTQAIDDTLTLAGVTEAEIDRVICVGGSTRLPAVNAVLKLRFADRVLEHDIFTSVAAGLAIQDYCRVCKSK